MKKYILAPGFVRTYSDKRRRYVGVRDLLRLYGVSKDECIVYNTGQPIHNPTDRRLIWLAPRPDGDYTLPELPDE